jgi:type IV pilus assembly protein PilN
MIKINLLAEGKKTVVRKTAGPSFKMPQRDLAAIIALVIAVVGLVGAVVRWWVLAEKRDQLVEQIAEAQREVEALKPVLQEVEDYKKKKEQLEHKISVINQLKENQRGPVQIMDHVSRALPDLLWLTRLELNGNNVTLAGEAFNTNAIANYLENLGKVPEFQEPVLGDVGRTGQTYTFQINFRFSLVKPAEQAAGGAPAAGG